MAAGVENGQRSAAPSGLPSTAEAFLSERTISVVQSHPRFQEAVRAAIGGLIEIYSRNGLLNRVMNDRGRAMGSMIALYLHFSPAPGGKGAAGLTVGRFQTVCVDLKLCSRGRARALLALMRLAGYLAPALGRAPDRRQRRLVPTEHLIEAQHRLCSFHRILPLPLRHVAVTPA